MSGIAVFVPDDEMYQQALEIEKENHVIMIKKVRTEDVVTEAQNAISEGANIIVARGRQAALIQYHTNIPVAEIMVTAQELGLLIMKAKNIVEKETPRIGVFGWGDMLCDTTYFNELYHVDLKRYQLKDLEEWRNIIEQAAADELDLIIGGEDTLEYAYQMRIPGLYMSGTGEALRLALKNAESLYRMAEIEQRNYAQFSTILDSSFSGIAKISVSGKVLVVNRALEQMLEKNKEQIVGQSLLTVLPGFDEQALEKLLSGASDSYSTFLTIQNHSLVISAEAIVVENRIDGAIISCSRMKHLDMNSKDVSKEQYLRGYVAYATLDDIDKNLKGMRKVVELARLYAQSSSPMLIEAMAGPEQDAIIQGIHNYSMRKNGPFVVVSMSGLTLEQQMETLFGKGDGKKGALEEANYGTLVIQGIDKLTLPAQYHLIRVIRSRRLMKENGLENSVMLDTRIIACTSKNLTELRRNFRFRSDLYFTLRSLRLTIPNLKDRKEDVEYLLGVFVKKYMEQYSRYHVLTAGAKKALLDYPWEGNSIQLEAFCERMILTVGKRAITEEYVRDLLDELYCQDTSMAKQEISEDPAPERWEEESEEPEELIKIKNALRKYNGNRTLSAKELKFSTTTLWRKMKKYGLDENMDAIFVK